MNKRIIPNTIFIAVCLVAALVLSAFVISVRDLIRSAHKSEAEREYASEVLLVFNAAKSAGVQWGKHQTVGALVDEVISGKYGRMKGSTSGPLYKAPAVPAGIDYGFEKHLAFDCCGNLTWRKM